MNRIVVMSYKQFNIQTLSFLMYNNTIICSSLKKKKKRKKEEERRHKKKYYYLLSFHSETIYFMKPFYIIG